MYKVINFFTDMQDNNFAYDVNDVYPREGLTPTEKRIKELASSKNRQGKPLIKKVAEPKTNKTKE